MNLSEAVEKSRVVSVVVAAVDEILEQREAPATGGNLETRLIGPNAVVDSLGLVTLIVDLEQRLEEEFGVSVTLASERAMSQGNSPFRSVGSLVDYAHGLLVEAQAHDRT